MGLTGTVTGKDGKTHVISIKGDKPDAEEQALIDSLAYGTGGVGQTMSGGLAGQTPEQELAAQARSVEGGLRSAAQSERDLMPVLTGTAGALLGTAVGGPPGGVIGGALGAGLGPAAAYGETGNIAERKAGLGPSASELVNQGAQQAAASLLFDTVGGVAGKAGRGILGIGNRANVIQEIDNAANVGIRTTASDLSRDWVKTGRKLVSIIPILGAPLRAAESNRAREIAAAVGRFRGPLDPLFGEAEMSGELLKAASNNFDSAVPWYKMFYQEAENYAKGNNIKFDATAAFDKAKDYGQAIERGRLKLNQAGTTVGTGTTPTGQSFLDTEITDAKDVAGFLHNLQFADPSVDFYQLDKTIKKVHEAFKAGSDTQRVALAQIGEELENAAKNSGDERFNFLYTNAKENFKTLKEFFGTPEAKKFQLSDADIFDTASSGVNKVERQQVSQLYRNLFKPEIGPDGVKDIAKVVRAETMDKAVRLNVRQRLDKHILDPENGKIDWSGLHAEFGLNDPSSLRYQTFKEMLANSKYGMSVDEFKQGLMTIESYVGDQLPSLSTQLLRSAALGKPSSALHNLLGTRAFNMEEKASSAVGKLLAKTGVIGALTGARSLTNFIADPDRLRVLMRYVDEAQVPISGSKLPVAKAGIPIPGATVEVGSGARQTMLATKKPVVRALEKRILQWLAFDLAHKTEQSVGDATFKAKQYYEQFQYAVDHPEQTEEDISKGMETIGNTSKGLFQQYLSGGQR